MELNFTHPKHTTISLSIYDHNAPSMCKISTEVGTNTTHRKKIYTTNARKTDAQTYRNFDTAFAKMSFAANIDRDKRLHCRSISFQSIERHHESL